MKKFLKKIGKLFCGALVIGSLGFNSVSAADNTAAMNFFREAMTKSAEVDKNRILHEDILFFVPTMQSELEFIGQMGDDTFKSAGLFNLWINDDKGDSSNLEIPFYITQDADEMQIYFETDKKWKKFHSPTLAAKATDIIATPNAKESEDIISDVKEVVILRDNDRECTMLVRLDGSKIAEEVKAEAEKNPADNGTAEDKNFQDNLMKYIDAGFRNADIWYTWTVNKQNWNTVALSLNLSNLVQQCALAALNDETQNWNELEQSILETLAYYSETKAFTTYLSEEAAKNLEIPKKALKAESVEDLVADKK